MIWNITEHNILSCLCTHYPWNNLLGKGVGGKGGESGTREKPGASSLDLSQAEQLQQTLAGDYLGSFNCETPWVNTHMQKCPQTLCAHPQRDTVSTTSDLCLIQGCVCGESFHKTEQTLPHACPTYSFSLSVNIYLLFRGSWAPPHSRLPAFSSLQ